MTLAEEIDRRLHESAAPARTAIIEAVLRGQWKPIETAPDGRILVCGPENPRRPLFVHRGMSLGAPIWCDDDGNGINGGCVQWWMYPPEPPDMT